MRGIFFKRIVRKRKKRRRKKSKGKIRINSLI